MIIAIDGPSGSGKGTTARLLGKTLNLAFLETGLLYRLLAFTVLRCGRDPSKERDILDSLAEFSNDLNALNEPTLREDRIAQIASRVAVFHDVREALLEYQRAFAHNPPPPAQGAILDGRDIGTVVLPNADLKIYLNADVKVRAERRWKELQSRGFPCILSDVLRDLEERDARDMSRAEGPLKPAPDAFFVDTSCIDPQTTVDQIIAHLNAQPVLAKALS